MNTVLELKKMKRNQFVYIKRLQIMEMQLQNAECYRLGKGVEKNEIKAYDIS